jgi:hypothetical protein
MKRLVFAVFCIAAAVVTAEKKPYDRYQSIVDRQMFGVPPPNFDPMKMPSEVAKTSQKELTKEQEKLQSSVHFSVINVAADGTPVVGFTDNSDPKAPVHHYLKVGQESGGWKVLSANAAEATMTIQKEGVELSLKLGDNSGKPSGSGAAATPAVASQSAAPAAAGGLRSGLLGGTLRTRRAMREKRLLEQQEAEKKAREQEREQERAQREQEREEQRQQLMAIQEELKRQREEKAAAKAAVQNEVQQDANNNAE